MPRSSKADLRALRGEHHNKNSKTTMNEILFDNDTKKTIQNRKKLRKNKNLLYWYQKLYELMFRDCAEIQDKRILEIGSGPSPLKLFYPNVLTSDIIDLDYLDYKFDCMEIDKFTPIEDESLDIITMTNVLHHLNCPVNFLENASTKLKQGGKVILAEPYLSVFSTVFLKLLHHEPTDTKIDKPELDKSEGPLSSANLALPYLIFFSDRGWDSSLRLIYNYDVSNCDFFSSTSYFITGGISHRVPVPNFLYRLYFFMDNIIQRNCPNILSVLSIIKLIKKGEKC
jgi:SAM-dependent methyltransferase